jgi:putative ABC transport system permease protein
MMGPFLDSLAQDVRYSRRALVRAPAFTIVAVLTLALGIGANTAIFSVVNAVLLRPLPYSDADRLVRIFGNAAPGDSAAGPARRVPAMQVADLPALRAQTHTLSHVAFYLPLQVTLAGDEAIRLEGTRVSADTFAMLGWQPTLGRRFDQKEELSGADAVIIVSHALWQRRFGCAPGVVGQSLTLDGRAYTVIGVMPRGFQFPDAASQFWIPFVAADFQSMGGAPIARLKDGVPLASAAAELSTLMPAARTERARAGGAFPPLPAGYELVPLQDLLVSPVRPALVVLTGAVGCVLLIACVNMANLLLARSSSRRREIAVRLAIGASRRRLIRQSLTESVLLAVLGGVAGSVLAYLGIELLQALGTGLPRRDIGPGVGLPRLDEISVDGAALFFTLSVSIVTGVLFGIAPAVRQAEPNPTEVLREGAGASTSGFSLTRRHRLQGLLVIAEIAMATMLFLGGGLLMRSLINLSRVSPGYDPTHVMTAQVGLPRGRYSAPQVTDFTEEVTARLRRMAGVQAAAYARQLPTVRMRQGALLRFTPDMPARIPLPPPFDARQPPESPDVRVVSRDFLTVMGIRVVAGRGFGEGDGAGRPQVMLINQTLARSGFLGDRPIGRQVYAAGRSPWEIVGIVEDVHQFDLDRDPDPQLFIDYRQEPVPPRPPAAGVPPPSPYFAVRTADASLNVASTLRAIVRDLDPMATVDNVATMEQLLSSSLSRPRLYAVLLGIFAGVAVALTAIGIYGVMAYSVAQRTREIGIRLALGAHRAAVIGLVLRQAAAVTVIGIVCGIGAAAAVSQYLRGLLFGLTPLDASTFAGVAVLFAAIAMFASYVPARRATKVDPLVALRTE